MAVPDWPPTRIMKDMFDKNYKAPSGNNVKLDIDFIPWPDYYTRLNASLTSGEKKYNMAVSDSQWLGAFIEGGYYRKINDLIDADPGPQGGAWRTCIPNPLQAYATYPLQVGELLRLPADAGHARSTTIARTSSATRTSRRTSRRSTTRSCPARPRRWTTSTGTCSRRSASSSAQEGREARRQGARRRFLRHRLPGRQGLRLLDRCRSTPSSGSMAANIWDETKAPKGQAEGVVNSPEAVKALDHYLRLTKYMPPVVKTGTMDIFKTDELFREGKVALERRLDRLRRELDQPGRPRRSPTRSPSPWRRASRGPTARSSAGRISAASPSCS